VAVKIPHGLSAITRDKKSEEGVVRETEDDLAIMQKVQDKKANSRLFKLYLAKSAG
jgi:hypothetical protein